MVGRDAEGSAPPPQTLSMEEPLRNLPPARTGNLGGAKRSGG